MEYQQLGNTGVFVSKLCLGAMTFGGAGTMSAVLGGLGQAEASKLVDDSLDAGVNFFDTANVYSAGESETMLGIALGARRKDVVIASKVFGRIGKGPNEAGLSRLHIMQQVEDSLKRLNTSYIDLYQIHGFDSLTPFEEILSALTDLVRQGKVRYIGCSNLAAWQIMKSLGVSALQHFERFITLQAYYSLVGRDLEREIIPMLLDQKVGLLVWSPLAGGFLSGKFTRKTPDNAGSRRDTFTFPPVDLESGYAVVDVLRTVARRRSGTVARIALAWLLHQPAVTSVIIGARKPEQLKDNLASVDLKLDSEDLRELNQVSGLRPEYPGWMFAVQGDDRRPGKMRDWSKFVKIK